MELSALDIVLVASAFLVAGAVKGAIGLGLPTISMSLMGTWLPVEQAAAIIVLPVILTNIWQGLCGPALGALLRRLWPLMATMVVCTFAAAALVPGGDSALTRFLLGAMVIAFAVHGLTGARFQVPPQAETALNPVIGAVTGLVTGSTAIFVIPLVPYLQSLDFGRDDLVQAMGLTALIATVSLALGLGVNGRIDTGVALPGAAAVATAFAGMFVGQAIRARLPVEVFRRWVLVGLLGLGAAMVLRAAL